MAASADSVALYWDFENLHAGLVDQLLGQGAYAAGRFRPQDELIEVSTIVETALSIGPLAINRAFANWLSFARYRQPLLHNAVELIQVFPPGANAKNGADIKLCLDVMDDMARFPHIGTIIVVGGDSDYMPLSYKVKAAGRTLVGIGSRRTTNQHWARSCHEFKFYETLIAPTVPGPAATAEETAAAIAAEAVSESAKASAATLAVTAEATAEGTTEAMLASATAAPAGATTADADARLDGPADRQRPEPAPLQREAVNTDELRRLLDAAAEAQAQQQALRELVTKAVLRLGQIRGERWIQKARLRPFIQRMDPTFHESSYGYDSFNALLTALDGVLETRRGEYDHELRLSDAAAQAAASAVGGTLAASAAAAPPLSGL